MLINAGQQEVVIFLPSCGNTETPVVTDDTESTINSEVPEEPETKESDENTHVYALRCGKQVIGTMTMTRTGQQLGNFTAWEVADEEFDLSYLLSDPISITVPAEFSVYSLGNQLGSSYITRIDGRL